MEGGLGILHGFDFLFTSLLIGGLIFVVCILSNQNVDANNNNSNWEFRLQSLVVISVILSIAWIICMTAEIAESWSLSDIWLGLTQTIFGRIWFLRFICLVLIGFFIALNSYKKSLLLALALPLFFGLLGHAGAQKEHIFRSLSLDYIHYLAVSIWTGGLLALWLWLSDQIKYKTNLTSSNLIYPVVKRFSHFAIVSTGFIAISGVLIAHFYGVSFSNLLSEDYGTFVLRKTVLFAMTLGLAGINQFIHLRKWSPDQNSLIFASRIRREVSLEITLVVVIFIVAGILSRLPLIGE